MCKKRIKLIDCYNMTTHGGGYIGTVVSNFSRYGLTNGWKIIYINETD